MVTETKYAVKTKLREMIFLAYLNGEVSRAVALDRIGVSNRQFIRLQNKFNRDKNLRHGLCGKASNYSINPEVKNKVLDLCKTDYKGWNYEHIHDSLISRNKISIHTDTIRNWLLSAKISLPKKRIPRKYLRREPKAQFNEMLQLDGTFADFLGDGRMLCLMHLVDDATKTSLAMLFEAESTNSALQILYQWCLKYGIPQSIYSDRHSAYKVNDRQKLTVEEELEGCTARLSEFGKVCSKLGIKQIFAHSPQAKGRVERKHQLYKDRWIKELRLANITNIADANVYLKDEFVDKINVKFTIDAKEARTACDLPTPTVLAEQFTIDTIRTVRNDYTIQFNNVHYQLPKNTIVNAKAKVIIKTYLDESLAIFAGKNKLKYTVIENYVRPLINDKNNTSNTKTKPKYIPPLNHQFRQYKPEKKYRQQSSSAQLQKMGCLYT